MHTLAESQTRTSSAALPLDDQPTAVRHGYRCGGRALQPIGDQAQRQTPILVH